MHDLVPWPLRHDVATVIATLFLLVAVSSAVWYVRIASRLRQRARTALKFVDKPLTDAPNPPDEALVTTVGRLMGTKEGKVVAKGTVLLDVPGPKPAHPEFGLSLERSRGRVILLGPYRVLVGAREGLPVGTGRRVLRAGDEVVVDGRWSVEKNGTATYREVATKGAIVPSYDVLEIAFAGAPQAIGLARISMKRGLLVGVILWGLTFSFGAAAALDRARSATTEPNQVQWASWAYLSPFTRSDTRDLLVREAAQHTMRDTNLAAQWAAIEAFLDDQRECLGVLGQLRIHRRLEDEARIGVACGGPSSRRRAADAYALLGEFRKAAEILHDAPFRENRDGDPDVSLDIRVALMTGNVEDAEKFLRYDGRTSLTPNDRACIMLAIEAHKGSLKSQQRLVEASYSSGSTCYLMNVEFHWKRALSNNRMPAR